MYLASQVGSEFHPLVSELSDKDASLEVDNFLLKFLFYKSLSRKQAFSTHQYLAKLVGKWLRGKEKYLIKRNPGRIFRIHTSSESVP